MIVGDVNPGAKIVARGNIVVLGSLDGNAYAGAAGNSESFVAALHMNPIQIKIADVDVYKRQGKVLNEKNTIAIVNKNQMYAYGDQAYAMYEKAPENINVTFPVINGVIADYANMQTMIFEFLEKYSKGKVRGAEFVVAVPTDITEVEKKAFFDIFAKSKVKPKGVLLCEKPLADAVGPVSYTHLIRW